ncbi:DUF6538 domain-containing protein [Loktanella sp. DJP18]|uniref:DUF6538 domain-containing protein n=1 Tax=Loktanella sp. DJP18 TaxID=3409788 RepID=UPI003BB68139
MTQSVTHACDTRPKILSPHRCRRSRPAGPYLQKRGAVFYFRKRLPKVISEKCGRSFLCLSLRTPLLPEAMSRAAHLLAVLESEEKNIMTNPILQNAPAEEITLLLSDALRCELARILSEQDAGLALEEVSIELRIATLERENVELKQSARRNDYSAVEPQLRSAAQALGIDLPDAIPVNLGRRAIELFRDLKDVEAAAVDGSDARSLAAPLVARLSDLEVDAFVESRPIRLSDASARALQRHPTKSMKGNIDAIANVALAFFGDVPISTITEPKQEKFFAWMAKLPKTQGRSHGKNRHTEKARKEGRLVKETQQMDKQTEIDIADALDEAVMEEIRDLEGISDLEKRALLVEKLQPRLTMATLRRNRDGLNRLFKAAANLGCKDVPIAISYKDMERALIAAAPDDPLYVRVTQRKIRMPWTEERLAKLLTSPIYAGCASPYRRWLPGHLIIRDAFYWVPLILLTIGSRIEEILLLKRKGLRLRNGVHCLALGRDPDATGKTADAERIVPIPQMLIDLGFVEWIKSLDDSHSPLLFPEIARRTTTGKISEAFGKAFKIIRSHLDLADFDEDFYALRKTLSSMLRAADVDDGERQALAGHKSGSIINLHYTAHNTRKLKTAVDKADFGLDIGYCEKHGHPVIKGCSLAPTESFAVEVTLSESGEADVICVTQNGTDETLFTFDRRTLDCVGQAARKAEQVAAGLFRKIVGEHPLIYPRHPLKRAAVEHFHALG